MGGTIDGSAFDESLTDQPDINAEFDDDELEALGEETEAKETPKPGDGEAETAGEVEDKDKKPEEPAKEGDEAVDDDDTQGPVPYERFSQIYGERKTFEEKLDLLKTDPDEYYKQHPDEKPVEGTTTETKETVTDDDDPKSLVIDGGQYDGKTLGEVFAVDPDAAYRLSPYHANRIQYAEHEAVVQEQAAAKDRKAAVDKEIESFSEARAKDMFGKEFSACTEPEQKQLEGITGMVTNWMLETGRGGGNIEDAYYLMEKDNIISDKVKEGVKDFVKKASKPPIPSVDNSKSTGGGVGFDAYLGMTGDQLLDAINNMDEGEYMSFVKNAPKSLKDKHPSMDWD